MNYLQKKMKYLSCEKKSCTFALVKCKHAMIATILVDDHELFRFGIKMAMTSRHLDIYIAGEAETGAELFRLLETTEADIVLLDIILPDMSGIDIALRLKKEKPAVKILVTSSENLADVTQALLNVGVNGFISKRVGEVDILAHAIRSIMSGFDYFGQDISDIIYKIYVAKKKTTKVTSEFTEQEKSIIELCRDGLSYIQIADKLYISTHTVENHKTNIFSKLGINSTMEMLQFAMKNGIIRMDNY